MKIKFFANFATSEQILKRFKDNYIINDNDLEFTTDDNYDVAVVFNKTYEEIKEEAKIITVIQEPSWSPVHGDNNFLVDSDYLLIHDQALFEKVHKIKLGGTVIETPSYMWFHDHVNHTFFNGSEKIKKRKKLSMIVSSIYMSIGNYKKRIELLNKIFKSDLDIDIYGRGLQTDDKRYKGELQNKFTGLLPYQYSISIENSNEKNYLTEKFIDPVLCGTIPIYNGAPNVELIYNKNSFKTIDLDSPTIIEDIKLIIEPVNPLININDLNKDIYFNDFNLYTKLKEILLNQ